MLKALRRASERRQAAEALAVAIGTRARAAVFYRDLAVPDTFNGRFDLLALHAFLALTRLEAQGARALNQTLVDTLFHSFEGALRDQGAGDMGMLKRLEKIAAAFYGRLEAYRAAADEAALAAALLRNVYGEDAAKAAQAGRLAAYALAARAHLAGQSLTDGRVEFGPLPEGVS